jgi:hypothetical protein
MPRFGFKQKIDKKQLVDSVSKLSAAGYECDVDDLSEKTGLKLTKKETLQDKEQGDIE